MEDGDKDTVCSPQVAQLKPRVFKVFQMKEASAFGKQLNSHHGTILVYCSVSSASTRLLLLKGDPLNSAIIID